MKTTFENLSKEFWAQLGQGKEMAFATSEGNKVTNRMMVVLTYEEKLYMLTDVGSTKCAQIRKNENVALCEGMLQITGTARILGGTMDEGNKRLAQAYKKAYEEYFDQYAAMLDSIFLEVSPQSAVVYVGETEGYKIDFASKTVVEIEM